MSGIVHAYISGPMSGVPLYNRPAFDAAAEKLRSHGFKVTNPSDNFGGRTDLPYEVYMREDFKIIAESIDTVFVLPGWKESKGARAEVHEAQLSGIPVFDMNFEEVKSRVITYVKEPYVQPEV